MAVNISVLTAPGWKTPPWGDRFSPGSCGSARTPFCFSSSRDFQPRGVTGHCLWLWGEGLGPGGEMRCAVRGSGEKGHCAGGRGEARSGGRGGTGWGETEAAVRPWSGDGAGDPPHPVQGVCTPGRGTGLGDVRVPARTLEIVYQGGKKPGASFYFILNGVRPHRMALVCSVKPYRLSLYPTRIFIFLVFPSLRLR